MPSAPGWRGLAYLPHGTAQTTKIKNNRRNTFSFSVSTGSNRGVRCGEGGASSDRFTPAKGQNFPKASRYLFLIVSIQRISVTKFKCPEHRIHTQNIKTAFLFFLFRKLETLLLYYANLLFVAVKWVLICRILKAYHKQIKMRWTLFFNIKSTPISTPK